jgi:hypothetical protein
MCDECDRLWHQHSEVSQKSFRLEAKLTSAQTIQNHELVQALAEQLASLVQEQNRTCEAFVEHQAKAHGRNSPPVPRVGD